MIEDPDYDQNVFINCPFDNEYRPLLNAVLFAIVRLGFNPRIAPERIDSGEARIAKLVELIGASKFGIHDLSRSQAKKARELARHNMPLELGIDLGARNFGSEKHKSKRHLILEEKPYRHQAAVSDLSNSDLSIHEGKPQVALKRVKEFLDQFSSQKVFGASALWGDFNDFQADLHVELTGAGFSDEDIKAVGVRDFLDRCKNWCAKHPRI